MWMPEASAQPIASEEVVGIVARQPQRVSQPGGIFSGRPQEIVLFRLETQKGQFVNCRFQGVLSGMLDQGDTVRASGTMEGGVLQVTRITDTSGAVLAQAACFVVTAVCGDPLASEVRIMRQFRDQVLMRSRFGRMAVVVYWRVGPILARWLGSRPRLCRCIRRLALSPLSRGLARIMGDS
jgi:hypothetical protein